MTVVAEFALQVWMNAVVALSVFIAALALVWNKTAKPVAKFLEIKPTLEEIATQFRGSTLKEQMDRLEETTERLENAVVAAVTAIEGLRRDTHDAVAVLSRKTEEATDALRIKAGVAQDLAERDRVILDRMVSALHNIARDTRDGAATGLRIQEAAAGVAEDLAASQGRADDATGEAPGAAADAASQSPEP